MDFIDTNNENAPPAVRRETSESLHSDDSQSEISSKVKIACRLTDLIPAVVSVLKTESEHSVLHNDI